MDTCPVCGLPGTPHLTHTICPCCGTAFGHDDRHVSHQKLMWNWIQAGCRWFGPTRPAGWDPHAQLVAAGLIARGGPGCQGPVASEQRAHL